MGYKNLICEAQRLRRRSRSLVSLPPPVSDRAIYTYTCGQEARGTRRRQDRDRAADSGVRGGSPAGARGPAPPIFQASWNTSHTKPPRPPRVELEQERGCELYSPCVYSFVWGLRGSFKRWYRAQMQGELESCPPTFHKLGFLVSGCLRSDLRRCMNSNAAWRVSVISKHFNSRTLEKYHYATGSTTSNIPRVLTKQPRLSISKRRERASAPSTSQRRHQ